MIFAEKIDGSRDHYIQLMMLDWEKQCFLSWAESIFKEGAWAKRVEESI